jgi:hypothetical protein
LLLRWEARAIDQYGNNRNIALERSNDLAGHAIGRIFQPTVAALVLGIEPIRPDDCEEDVGDG